MNWSNPERIWLAVTVGLILGLVAACVPVWGQTVTVEADVTDIVEPVERRLDAVEALAKDLQRQINELRDSQPTTPPAEGATITAPDTAVVGEPYEITVTGADRVWVREVYGGTERITDIGDEPDEVVPAPYTLTLTPTAPGKIRIEANPGTDAVVVHQAVVEGKDAPGPVSPPVDDRDWQAKWDALPDGGTLVIPEDAVSSASLVIRDKKNATLRVEGPTGRRARLVDQTLLVSGRLEQITIEGLAVVRPQRDPLSDEFDADRVPLGSVGLTAVKDGLRLYVDGLTFRDCEFVGHTFGVSLRGYSPDQDNYTGEFIRGLRFERTIFRDCYNSDPAPDKFRSSGVFLERVDGATFEDCTFVRPGYNPGVRHSVRANENQGIYHNSSSGELTVLNSVFFKTAFCPVQGRSDATAEVVGNVFIGCGGSTYVRQGEIRDFVAYQQEPVFKDGGSQTTEGVMSQQSRLANPEPVTIKNGLVAEPLEGTAGWYAAVKVRTPTRISNVHAVGVPNLLADEATVLSRDGLTVGSDYDRFKNPGTFPGGVDEYIEAQITRKRGEWDENRHGAGPMLRYVGVTE